MDLRDWLDKAAEIDQVRTILKADWNKEIGAIGEVAPRYDKRALLFDEINGFPKGYRILMNAMINPSTFGLTLGLPTDLSLNDLVATIEEKIPMWEARMGNCDPKEVNDGPVMEKVQTGE